MNSYDVRFWQIETRRGKAVTYRVRWVVAGRQFGDSFTTKELAESYRAKLRAAARRGEGFDTDSGLPESMVRTLRDVSFYEHCAEFAAATWAMSAAKTRVSVIETLTRVVPVVVTDLKGAPELNSGVPATEVAAWAGHSVEVLMRVYARCVTGLEDVWISRMDDALRMEGDRQDSGEGR